MNDRVVQLTFEQEQPQRLDKFLVEQLPEFFEIEPLSPHGTVYDVKNVAIAAEIDEKLKSQL